MQPALASIFRSATSHGTSSRPVVEAVLAEPVLRMQPVQKRCAMWSHSGKMFAMRGRSAVPISKLSSASSLMRAGS
jgi:hypothetical protein